MAIPISEVAFKECDYFFNQLDSSNVNHWIFIISDNYVCQTCVNMQAVLELAHIKQITQTYIQEELNRIASRVCFSFEYPFY